jgi:hypothetical protein
MSRRGSGLLGVVSAVQRAHSQAQRAQQQQLRAQDLAQRKERQQERASLDRIKLEMKKLEMRRRVSSHLTDQELINLVVMEHTLAFQFPLAPEERDQGLRLIALALEAHRQEEEAAAALLRQKEAAAEVAVLHEAALQMNEQPRLMREHGLAVILVSLLGFLVLAGTLILVFGGR